MRAGVSNSNLDAKLVLGLTLAEVLSLLLVALLFGLAGVLQHAMRDPNRPGSAPAAVAATGMAEGQARSPAADRAERDASAQLRITALEAALGEARRENQALQASLAELDRLKDVNEAATKINPSAPVAALQDGLRTLEALGPTADPVRNIQQLKVDSEAWRAAQGELQEYQRLLEEASRADPNAPPAHTLQRALASSGRADEGTGSETNAGRLSRAQLDESRSAQIGVSEGAGDGAKTNGLPPCWQNASGDPEYLFEITLRDDHLTLRDLAPSARAKDAGYRLSRALLRRAKYAAEEFRKASLPLLRTSLAQGCRHAVQVRDSTAPGSKEAYKGWRSLIDPYFVVRPVS